MYDSAALGNANYFQVNFGLYDLEIERRQIALESYSQVKHNNLALIQKILQQLHLQRFLVTLLHSLLRYQIVPGTSRVIHHNQ